MKRLLGLALAIWWGWHVHAQGTFIFSNRVTAARVDAPVFDIGGATRVEGPNFVAAIFLNGIQLGATAPFRTGSGSGYWNPGEDSVRAVAGHYSGEIVSGFTVKVWDSSRGADAHSACMAGGKTGESRTFSIQLGGPKADPAQPPDLPEVMLNFQAFTLFPFSCVPEPSVLALAALGAAMLTLGRDRQPRAPGCQNESDL